MSYLFKAIICLLFLFSSVFSLEGMMTRKIRLAYRKRGKLNDISSEVAALPSEYISPAVPDMIGADYVFTPPEVGAEIWTGTIVSLIPIVWATYEFTSRIRVQRNCLVCTGSGLTYVTRKGTKLARPRKCWSCGGFIPWLGWKMFFLSTFTDPGNGGVLQRPSRDYEQTNQRIRESIGGKKGDDKVVAPVTTDADDEGVEAR